MTLVSTVDRNDYIGSGITGPYAYTYRIVLATDLLVTTRDLSGIETVLSYPSEYTVAGVGDREGGTITLTIALADDWTMTVRRVRPLTQGTQLRNQGAFFPETVEDALDNAMVVAQQLANNIAASVHLPETVDPADFNTTLPATLVPGNAIVVNGAGTGFSMAELDSATLSAWSAAHNQKLDVFTSAHGDYTPGVTAQLTLSSPPGSLSNVWVSRRTSGVVVTYETDEYSVSGTTLTFTSPIPSSTTRVEVRYFYTYQINTADAANVTYAPASGSGTDVRTRLRAHDATLATLTSRVASLSISVKDAPFNCVGDGSHNDTVGIQAASDAVHAAGGGELYFPPGRYLITSDITYTRITNIRGAGGGASFLYSATGNALKIKGADANWIQVTSYMGFDGVQLLYGETLGDFANGCSTVRCEIQNCAVGILYVYNAYQNTIDNCKIHDCPVGVQYDLATAGVTSGAIQIISNSTIFNLPVGVLYTGGPGGLDLMIANSDIEHCTEAGVKTVGATEDVILMHNIHLELYDPAAYFIVNDGAHVFLDGFWALSATEAAWFWNKSGDIYVKNGRGSWNIEAFARIDAGFIQVDPDSIFCASHWWGTGITVMATTDSTGGMIVGPRSTFAAVTNKTFAALTNASPGPLTTSTINPYDGNERVWEFDVACTAAVAANNILRVSLTNGHSTVRVDLSFPLVVGGAHIRVTHTPGGAFAASGVYAPAVAGDAAWIRQTTTDTSILADPRFLVMETINGGSGTKATMTISGLCETVAGPHQTAL